MSGSFNVTAQLRIDETLGHVHDAALTGLFLAGEHILTTSNEHVPHAVGDLQGSGTVSEDRGSYTVAVSYNTPYAVKQHEDTSLHHPDPARTAKYLENACNSERKAAAAIISQTARSQIGD